MAQEVFPGRFTADIGRETVTVFLIGMRANRQVQGEHHE